MKQVVYMGLCCKCGRETAHVYAYWSGDSPDRKTCVNVQEHAAFLCSSCALAESIIYHSVFLTAWVIVLGVRIAARPDIVSITTYSVMTALYLSLLLHALYVGRRDKKLPFYAKLELAEKRIVKVMQKQNSEKNYFVPSDYH